MYRLFPTGDASELAKALLTALDQTAGVVDRVASGRERADEFSMAKLADAYLARYERLVQ